MRKLRLSLFGAMVGCACAIGFSPGTASADVTATCPDHYEPVPVMALPPEDRDVDKNMNLSACAKGPQGNNGHFNAKDDKQPQYVDDIV
jgi:hypothetical protein